MREELMGKRVWRKEAWKLARQAAQDARDATKMMMGIEWGGTDAQKRELTLAQECEDAADTVENLEFPGMYG